MKWKKPTTTIAAIMLIVLPLLFVQGRTSLAEPATGTVVSTELINFYSMTTNEVTTFVQLLKTQGIPLFIARLGTSLNGKAAPVLG